MSLPQMGIVSHGRWHLALPINELIEVIPCQALTAWPTSNKAVRGCIDVRGNIIPVIDLELFYYQENAPFNSVAIVQTATGVFALATDAVEGIVSLEHTYVTMSQNGTNLPASILLGGFYREETKQTILILDVAALVNAIQIPIVSFKRQLALQQNQSLRAMMLARCGQLFFALDAISVYSTVLNPQILPMDVQNDYLVGAISFQQVKIPAIDFLAWCRLQSRVKHQINQAFVVQLAEGFVALLVEEILDVIDMPVSELAALPPMSLPAQDKFKGLLNAKQLNLASTDATNDIDYLIEIDASKLHQDNELTAIAKTTAQQQAKTHTNISGGDLLIFEAGSELCVPLQQIVEILPWQSQQVWQQDAESGCGLMLYRDYAICIFHLSRLFNLVVAEDTCQQMIVLVVEQNGLRYGFAVEKLTSIEKATSEIKFSAAESSNPAIETALIKINRPQQPMVTCINFLSICTHLASGVVPTLTLVKQVD